MGGVAEEGTCIVTPCPRQPAPARAQLTAQLQLIRHHPRRQGNIPFHPANAHFQRHSCQTNACVPMPHLELVGHHVPQALVVDYPNVDVDREGLPRDAADHDLAAVAREPSLLQQLAKLGVVHRLAAVAGLEGGGVHKLAAA